MGTKKISREKGRSGNFWKDAAEGSIAHMLSESPGGLEGALERLKAAKAAGKVPSVAIALGEEPAADSDDSDALTEEDRARVRAFADNQKPTPGVVFHDYIQEDIERGRTAVEALASGRLTQLSLRECADVARFISCTAPRELLDPNSQKSPDPYCGLLIVMGALEGSVRARSQVNVESAHSALEIATEALEEIEDDQGNLRIDGPDGKERHRLYARLVVVRKALRDGLRELQQVIDAS